MEKQYNSSSSRVPSLSDLVLKQSYTEESKDYHANVQMDYIGYDSYESTDLIPPGMLFITNIKLLK